METGLFSTRQLVSRGLTRADIRRAIESGGLARVRRGWHAVPGTPPGVVTAARVGGRLTCVPALRMHGAWTLDQPTPHVQISSGVAVGRVGGARLHWTADRVEPGLDSAEDALAVAIRCADLRALVVVVDSLANRRILTPARLRGVLEATARGRQVLALHDSTAESGIETLVRLALYRLQLVARSQVAIPDIGRVDFLIGERLVIEADGYEWHADRLAFERDRARDRELVRRGYVVIRASYRQVVDDLEEIMIAVTDIVRRRDHRWRAVHRTQLSKLGYHVDLSLTDTRISES
jgi:very-short-patch-repair endonuclease